MKRLAKVFIFFSFIIFLVLSFFIVTNRAENNNKIDIGTDSFELFRQVVAYSYRDFVEDIDLKSKLNQTLEKIYNTLNYGGFKVKLYKINSQSLKDQINDFENYYNQLFSQISNSKVDIYSSLSSKKINENQREVYKNFYELLKEKKAFLKFVIQSYCSTLDKYTEYMGPKEYSTFKESMQGGNFSGVGIVMFRENREKGEVVVVEVIEDSPAEKNGIKSGDKIIKVDDKDITNISLDTIQSMIRGPENTKVKLTIKRDDKLLDFELIRKIIHIKSVVTFNNDDIPVFRIKTFSIGTANEFLQAYKKANNPSHFIIDLRNNGGGLLDESVNVLSYFVGSNKLAVYLKRKNQQEQVFYTKHQKQIQYSKVVILVNEYTASASEILAQSFKDYLKDDLIIIGTKTYGKNTVQTLYNLLDNGVLKMTIGKYFTISNRDIYKDKVSLDYEVIDKSFNISKFYTNEDLQYKKALEILKKLK